MAEQWSPHYSLSRKYDQRSRQYRLRSLRRPARPQAGVTFLVGNAGIIILGRSLGLPAPLRLYSYLSGSLALVALGCFVSAQYLGLGEGGMERVAAYPQTAWLIVIGLYWLAAGQRARPLPADR